MKSRYAEFRYLFSINRQIFLAVHAAIHRNIRNQTKNFLSVLTPAASLLTFVEVRVSRCSLIWRMLQRIYQQKQCKKIYATSFFLPSITIRLCQLRTCREVWMKALAKITNNLTAPVFINVLYEDLFLHIYSTSLWKTGHSPPLRLVQTHP